MRNNQKQRWWLNAALFTGLILSFFVDALGVDFHQWIGALTAALAAYHLLAHREWLSAVGRRFFGGTSAQARWYYLVDHALGVSFAVMIVTGLAISTWLDLSLADYPTWRTVHVAASLASLALVVVKIALHARWITATSRKLFAAPAERAGRPLADQPASAERRAFLKLMGVVGAASLIALGTSLHGLSAAGDSAQAADSDAETGQASQAPAAGRSPSSSGRSAPSAGCCNRGCAYPGHCRRYVDSNGNNRCDLGEC